MKQLIIALDPGFDGCKIIINKKATSIPFIAKDETGNDAHCDGDNPSNFLQCEINNKTYLVGEAARLAWLNEDHISKDHINKTLIAMEEFYSLKARFKSEMFTIIVNAALGNALYNYSESTDDFDIADLSKYSIKLGVALPHEFQDDLWKIVKPVLEGKHEFKLTIDKGIEIDFNFSIDGDMISYISQTIAVINNEVLDEFGNQINETIEDMLPALIIDGGYKTIGEVFLSRTLNITGYSNVEYAMMNINQTTAAKIENTTGKAIPAYSIEKYAKKNIPIQYMTKDNKVNEVKVKDIKNMVIKETESKFMNHILTTFNNLLEVNTIFVAGGTGNIYYNYIKDFCDKERSYLSDHIKLSTVTLDGQQLSPVYAIAAGTYKALCCD